MYLIERFSFLELRWCTSISLSTLIVVKIIKRERFAHALFVFSCLEECSYVNNRSIFDEYRTTDVRSLARPHFRSILRAHADTEASFLSCRKVVF